jgi:hypothetical protein
MKNARRHCDLDFKIAVVAEIFGDALYKTFSSSRYTIRRGCNQGAVQLSDHS